MGFLSHVLKAQMELESSYRGRGYNQLMQGLNPSLFIKDINTDELSLKVNNKKGNCRNCGANSFKNNKCEYCKTEI